MMKKFFVGKSKKGRVKRCCRDCKKCCEKNNDLPPTQPLPNNGGTDMKIITGWPDPRIAMHTRGNRMMGNGLVKKVSIDGTKISVVVKPMSDERIKKKAKKKSATMHKKSTLMESKNESD